MRYHDSQQLLNTLVRNSEDARVGFAEAAEEATRPELKSLFTKRSIDCGTAVVELRCLARSVGSLPEDEASFDAMTDHGWIKIRTAVGDANMVALEQVERAEADAERVYLGALETSLPFQIQSVLQRQYERTVRHHQLIRMLRDSYRPTTLPW